ncbi:MAG: diguanylate cyclase [Thiobacillus sp.]
MPNREGFSNTLAQMLTGLHENHERLALLFIDIDRLKNINDGLGHGAGDHSRQRDEGRPTHRRSDNR